MHAAILITALISAAPLPAPRSGQLRVQLFDFATREPCAAMVRISEGKTAYGPGRATPGGWFPLRGALRLELAPGRYRIQVNGGRRRLPYDKSLNVYSGKLATRSIYVKTPRYLMLERSGWICLDPLYSAGSRSLDDAALVAESVGLSAVGVTDPPAAVSQKLRTRMPLLTWKSRPDMRYGLRLHVAALESARSVPAGGSGFSFYADCGRPRRFNPWSSVVPWKPGLARFYDLLPSRPKATRGIAPRMYYQLLAGGKIGGFELDGSEAAQKLWFALLKLGYRVPAMAGSRDILSGGGKPEPRMLVNLGNLGKLDPRGPRPAALIARALQAGRSTLSFGPFCLMSLDDALPGSELPTEEKDRRLKVLVAASTDRRAEISRVVIYRDGEIFREIKPPPERTALNLDLVIRQEEPCWFVAKCWQRIRGSRKPETVAITNPIWLESKAYSTIPKPVKTRLKLRVVDAGSGRPIAATVVAGKASARKCPGGSFEATVSPLEQLRIDAPGYDARKIHLLEHLGLLDFARKYAAMSPGEVERKLCDPLTFALLRQAMRHCQITVKLQRTKKPE
jgi:hypothetical protein